MVLFLLQSKLVLVRGFIPPQWTRVSLWCHPAFDVTLRAAKGLFRSAERSAGYPPGCFPGCHPERSEGSLSRGAGDASRSWHWAERMCTDYPHRYPRRVSTS